jgi:hypothetical protein
MRIGVLHKHATEFIHRNISNHTKYVSIHACCRLNTPSNAHICKTVPQGTYTHTHTHTDKHTYIRIHQNHESMGLYKRATESSPWHNVALANLGISVLVSTLVLVCKLVFVCMCLCVFGYIWGEGLFRAHIKACIHKHTYFDTFCRNL